MCVAFLSTVVCVHEWLSNSSIGPDLDTTNWLEAFMRAVFTAAPHK